MKEDHANRPIWIVDNCHIFLESFSPLYQPATDFLIAISQPVNRPTHIHEYELTKNSLYAAVSVQLHKEDIIQVLSRLCKNLYIPKKVVNFIDECTSQYGQAKLVLKDNKYFIESYKKDIIEELLKLSNVNLAHYKMKLAKNPQNEQTNTQIVVPIKDKNDAEAQISLEDGMIEMEDQDANKSKQYKRLKEEFKTLFEVDEDMEDEQIEKKAKGMSLQIHQDYIEQVRSQCLENNYPLLEEYDFKRDTESPNLPIELDTITKVRPYQEMALSKMFSNGRARSGIIVLPCGAGKTLVGITATTTVKKRTLVLCTSCVSVEQWKAQYMLWTTIDPKKIIKFSSATSKKGIDFDENEAGIIITTYSMMGQGSSEDTMRIMNFIKSVEWGLLVLDEVQVVPANMFRKVLTTAKSHCKLGLTATLVREDDKIADLNFLIGPKLYEANWLDLQNRGFLARVQCIEVWCEMTPEFYKPYLEVKHKKKIVLYVNNPNKFMACQYLMNLHERRGDKIIVFSDNLFALEKYAKILKKPFIHSKVSDTEKLGILHYFQRTDKVNTIFISKVGDTSIDLPSANVIIQISSHFGSRRQEAQRLGRILRPKESYKDEKYNAFFYSLCSKNTSEMIYAHKRQQFLVDQGYAFTVVKEMPFMKDKDEKAKLKMSTKQEQIDLLEEILGKDEDKIKDEEDVEADPDARDLINYKSRTTGMGSLTGARGLYEEV